jgi:hypothetical protein
MVSSGVASTSRFRQHIQDGWIGINVEHWLRVLCGRGTRHTRQLVYEEMEDVQELLSLTGWEDVSELDGHSQGKHARYLCFEAEESRRIDYHTRSTGPSRCQTMERCHGLSFSRRGSTPLGRVQRYCHDQRIPHFLTLKRCGDGLQ